MHPTEPLQLHHSWPIDVRAARHDVFAAVGNRWRCSLPDNRLQWDDGVYDLFGLPRGQAIDRDLAVRCYEEGSRAVMERLRAYAIRHRRGFTVDVEVGPPAGHRQPIRLIASPVLERGKVIALEGVKYAIGD